MQEYDVSRHGDSLEKFASNFIRNRFPNYELVWKSFIGNKGNQTMANIPKYLDNKKRRNRALHKELFGNDLSVLHLVYAELTHCLAFASFHSNIHAKRKCN
jgi:hypothetical protein